MVVTFIATVAATCLISELWAQDSTIKKTALMIGALYTPQVSVAVRLGLAVPSMRYIINTGSNLIAKI